MVEFFLKSKDDDRVIYEYYPEGKMDKQPGLISVCLKEEVIQIDTVAEIDIHRYETAEEFNEHVRCLNEELIENGYDSLTEEELPLATKDMEWYVYGSKVIERLIEQFDNGEIPDKGMVVWY
jgi:hypothetical protein